VGTMYSILADQRSHIDTAWLWRYTQTHQKIARSWSTQCDLMDRFPNYRFAASSAQHYVWLKEFYPETFERVAKYVSQGRFAPVGGAWLEHDCMIPSGESFARQYLYGQRYFEDTFGARCREAWLPDTFGYASQLPQILRLCGIDYFFTQKVSLGHCRFPDISFRGTTSTPFPTRHSIGAV
jgi:alpha-mannosidase